MARPMDLSDSEGRETFMRITAFEHLFSILDGDDRDAAIERARAWLQVLYRDAYDTNSRVMRGVRRLADEREEWPDEL